MGHDGALSILFQAHDNDTGNKVAIKFFDPDKQLGFSARYRMDLFEREAGLLDQLQGKARCLQLVQPFRELEIDVSDTATGRTVKLVCGYLVTEWLVGDITHYFLDQHRYEALPKLLVFRHTVLALSALHRANIAHRDLKQDNLRQRGTLVTDPIIAIDLGTALNLLSPRLGTPSDYSEAVGAGAFSPIEAHCGLSGVRSMATETDFYALGCILHDLFNVDLFAVRLYQDQGFKDCLGACETHMKTVGIKNPCEATLMNEWNKIISRTKRQVSIPDFISPNSSCPPGLAGLLSTLHSALVRVDYRDRISDPTRVITLVDSAIRILGNERAASRRTRVRKQRWIQRLKRYKENRRSLAHK